MTEEKKDASPRKIEREIEIAASPDAIWKALTNPEELTRWFPLEARVDPGKGGKIILSWGPAWEATAPISIWEPGKHLQTIDPSTGQPLTVDWRIESRGGKTYLRLVQSGFATGADWENEFWDSTDYGWTFMLTNLRHYLAHHAGQPRLVAWPREKSAVSCDAIYDKLIAPGGLFVDGAQTLREGRAYSARTATGDTWSGRVEFAVASRGFCVTVDSLNNGLAWLTIEGAGEHDAQLWFSLYGLPQAQVTELENRWAQELKRILS